MTNIKFKNPLKKIKNEFRTIINNDINSLSLELKKHSIYNQLKYYQFNRFYKKNYFLVDFIYHGSIQIFHSLFIGNYTLILDYYSLSYFYSVLNITNIKRKKIFSLVLFSRINKYQKDQIKTSIIINNIKWS